MDGQRAASARIRHRLAVLRHAEEVSGSVAADVPLLRHQPGLCSTSGATATRELGEEGLRDRSSRPHHSPRATRSEVVAKIVYLRQHYHFGPLKISMYLKRYHDIETSNSGGVEGAQPPGHGPGAARQPALQAPQPALEALREDPSPAIRCRSK